MAEHLCALYANLLHDCIPALEPTFGLEPVLVNENWSSGGFDGMQDTAGGLHTALVDG